MKLKHEIDFKGLEKYLKTLSYSDIETNWQKPTNPKLIEGHSIEEIEYFKTDKSKIPLEKIINYGEPFLVDALGNDLSIVILSKRKYKLPTGRVIHAKFVTTVLDDCRSVFGSPINGYWKIPSQFIKPLSSETQDWDLPNLDKPSCDVCGSDDVIEAPHMGKNCNFCNPI